MKTIFLSTNQVESLLESAAQDLFNAPRHAIAFDPDWPLFAPTHPGVYCIYDGKEPVYVGETGSIRKRMRDLRRTMNHTFRRALGKYLYSGHAGYSDANAKTKFPGDIEQKLDAYMATKLSVVVVPVILGRKELEEHIMAKLKPRFNSRSKRQ